MSTDGTDAAPGKTVEATGRPRTVEYALYAILAECLFSIGYSFALYGARSYVIDGLRKDGLHTGWSEQQLQDAFPSRVRDSIITAIAMVVLILLIAKFIRDGKNWARLLFAALTVLPVMPLNAFQVIGFLGSAPVLARLASGLAGLSAVAAVVLLFIKPSSPFFRKVGVGRVSLRQALFPSRESMLQKYTDKAAAKSGSAKSGNAQSGNAKSGVAKSGVAKPGNAKPGNAKSSASGKRVGVAARAPAAAPEPVPASNRPRAKSRKVTE